MPGDDTSTLYGEVKAWIAQQEAYEAATEQPAPLTNAQRKALEVLRQPLTAPTPPPEIGDVDYISLLNRYRQAHPEGGDIVWEEAEASSKAVGGAIGRICRVAISETYDQAEAPIKSFPAIGYGLGDGEQPPVFSKKKDAKKYAAKCAVEWLIAQSLMPDNLSDVSFPRGYRPGSNGVPASPPKRSAKGVPSGGPVDVEDETLPATQRVDALCPQMGLRPPSYACQRTDAEGLDGYYDGYPNFGPDVVHVDPKLEKIRVTRVFGQVRARQKMAELVLDHLLPIYRDRKSVLDSLSAPAEIA